jgi:hypothetical protein
MCVIQRAASNKIALLGWDTTRKLKTYSISLHVPSGSNAQCRQRIPASSRLPANLQAQKTGALSMAGFL